MEDIVLFNAAAAFLRQYVDHLDFHDPRRSAFYECLDLMENLYETKEIESKDFEEDV